jgi:hypothetical protein
MGSADLPEPAAKSQQNLKKYRSSVPYSSSITLRTTGIRGAAHGVDVLPRPVKPYYMYNKYVAYKYGVLRAGLWIRIRIQIQFLCGTGPDRESGSRGPKMQEHM